MYYLLFHYGDQMPQQRELRSERFFVPHNCEGSTAAYHWGSELSFHVFNHENKAEAPIRNQERLRKLKAHLYFLQEPPDSYRFHNSQTAPPTWDQIFKYFCLYGTPLIPLQTNSRMCKIDCQMDRDRDSC